ncbi:MAG: hypothetical protein LBL36_05170, partial [Clostridiales Family XIII bacterium]|nr:hypothetical protein [Clostridiales Family XIII bacterium]
MRKICVCGFIIMTLLFTACSGKTGPSAPPAPEAPASSEQESGKKATLTDDARALGITQDNY